MIETRIYSSAELPPLLERQVNDFVRLVWSRPIESDPVADRDWLSRDPINIIIADGDTLISNVTVLTFSIEHAGESYRVCGVSGVMTYPEYRKFGYGSQAVAAANKYIESKRADFGMLMTGPDLHKFYKNNGWVVIPNITLLVGDKDHPHEDDANTLMYPVSERGLQAVKAFENARVYIGTLSW